MVTMELKKNYNNFYFKGQANTNPETHNNVFLCAYTVYTVYTPMKLCVFDFLMCNHVIETGYF